MIENSKRADKMWETRNSNTDSSVTGENALNTKIVGRQMSLQRLHVAETPSGKTSFLSVLLYIKH